MHQLHPHRYRPDNLNSLCTATGSVSLSLICFTFISIYQRHPGSVPLSLSSIWFTFINNVYELHHRYWLDNLNSIYVLPLSQYHFHFQFVNRQCFQSYISLSLSSCFNFFSMSHSMISVLHHLVNSKLFSILGGSSADGNLCQFVKLSSKYVLDYE